MKRFIVFLWCIYCLFVSSISFALSKSEIESLVYSTQFRIGDHENKRILSFKFPPYNSDNLLLGPCSKTGIPSDGCTGILPLASIYFEQNKDTKYIFVVDGVNYNGGSPTYYCLWGIYLDDGKVITTVPLDLGDRIIIKSATVKSDTITINAIIHGNGEAACCPKTKSILKYKIQGQHLIKLDNNNDGGIKRKEFVPETTDDSSYSAKDLQKSVGQSVPVDIDTKHNKKSQQTTNEAMSQEKIGVLDLNRITSRSILFQKKISSLESYKHLPQYEEMKKESVKVLVNVLKSIVTEYALKNNFSLIFESKNWAQISSLKNITSLFPYLSSEGQKQLTSLHPIDITDEIQQLFESKSR